MVASSVVRGLGFVVCSGDFISLCRAHYRSLLIEYLHTRNTHIHTWAAQITLFRPSYLRRTKTYKHSFSFNQTNRMEICSYCSVFVVIVYVSPTLHCDILFFFLFFYQGSVENTKWINHRFCSILNCYHADHLKPSFFLRIYEMKSLFYYNFFSNFSLLDVWLFF